ncbi:MAG: hypothetical protein ACYTDT_02255 [Planctomycetota bacterium]
MKNISIEDIPDMNRNPAEKYVYLEHSSTERFSVVFDEIGDGHIGLMPTSGGMMNEEIAITLPTGTSFCCISTRGDHAGWKFLIETYAACRGLGIGSIANGEFGVLRGKTRTTY